MVVPISQSALLQIEELVRRLEDDTGLPVQMTLTVSGRDGTYTPINVMMFTDRQVRVRPLPCEEPYRKILDQLCGDYEGLEKVRDKLVQMLADDLGVETRPYPKADRKDLFDKGWLVWVCPECGKHADSDGYDNILYPNIAPSVERRECAACKAKLKKSLIDGLDISGNSVNGFYIGIRGAYAAGRRQFTITPIARIVPSRLVDNGDRESLNRVEMFFNDEGECVVLMSSTVSKSNIREAIHKLKSIQKEFGK